MNFWDDSVSSSILQIPPNGGYAKTVRSICTYRSLNAIVALPKNCPFGVNITIRLKNLTTTSDSSSTPFSQNMPHYMALLSGVGIIFNVCFKIIQDILVHLMVLIISES
jgi:hypothetical protein